MNFLGIFNKFLVSLIFLKCFLSIILCNKPKISVKSGQITLLNDKNILDIKANATLRLKCEGSQTIIWSFPQNDPYASPIENLTMINSKCSKNKRCVSEMTLPNIQFWQTGSYSCHYNQLNASFDSVYVFINDPDNLIVPVNGNDLFIAVSVLENSLYFMIPCKPTDSRAEVSLHLYDTQNENFIKMPNDWMSFEPTTGFKVNRTISDQYTDIDCRVKSGEKEQYIAITIHTIKLSRTRLYPYINVMPNTTRIGDNITLICFVNIALNTFVDISWDFNTDFDRKLVSSTETVTKQSIEGVFETVSRSLTIINATNNDSGVYSCNVTDISQSAYTVSKSLLVGNSSPEIKLVTNRASRQFFDSAVLLAVIQKMFLTKYF